MGDPRFMPTGGNAPNRGGLGWLSADEIAIGTFGQIEVMSLDRGLRLRKLAGGRFVRSSADRTRLLTSDDKALLSIEPATGATVRIPAKGLLLGGTISADGAVIGSSDGARTMFWSSTGASLRSIEDAHNVEFAASGHDVLLYRPARPGGSEIARYDVDNDRIVWSLPVSAQILVMRAWSGGFAIGLRSGEIALLDGAGKLTGVLSGHVASVTDLAIHGSLLASSSFDGTVRLWDLSKQAWLGLLISRLRADGRGELDWVILGADGRVDGSPGMHSQITWQIGKDFLPGEAGWWTQKTPGLWSEIIARGSR
jgi:WD40 repeat protein